MQTDPSSFDFKAIRPYHDDEVNEVLKRLSQKVSFPILMSHLFPDQSPEQVVEDVKHIHSTRDFQAKYIHGAIRGIEKQSTKGLTFEGIEEITDERSCLFISNHRDIILDSAFLNILLFEKGIHTTQIAIGDNLMASHLVSELMRLNKSFVVHRSPARSEVRHFTLRLSTYIRQIITGGQSSIWLAQRSGRAKDGNDQTQPSLLKMLCMSSDKPFPLALADLHIRPKAISFEFEPCLGLKAEELVHRSLNLPYEKDDKQAIIQGIRAPKGRVHLAIGPDLSDAFANMSADQPRKLQVQAATDLIDSHIHRLYRLWPNNYIAADLIEGQQGRSQFYSPAEVEAFQTHLNKEIKLLKGPVEALRQQMLDIYANPVFNAEKVVPAD